MVSKMGISEGKHLFFEDFWCHLYFFDLEYHVVWIACIVIVDYIVPMKNYEVHVLISLNAFYNSKGRILKRTLIQDKQDVFRTLGKHESVTEIEWSTMRE